MPAWIARTRIPLAQPASQSSALLKAYHRNFCSSRFCQRISCSRCTLFNLAQAVRAQDVFAQPILLPPTREQERIVSKLSAAFSGVEKAETATRRARERLQRYRNAVLDAAVTGKLTRVWRESQPKSEKISTESGDDLLHRLLLVRRELWEKSELARLCDGGKTPKDEKWKSRYPEPSAPVTKNLPELPSTWIWASLEQISTRVTVGYVGEMKNEYVSKGIPFLRSQNVHRNRFEPEGLVFIRRQFHAKLAKSKVTPAMSSLYARELLWAPRV